MTESGRSWRPSGERAHEAEPFDAEARRGIAAFDPEAVQRLVTSKVRA